MTMLLRVWGGITSRFQFFSSARVSRPRRLPDRRSSAGVWDGDLRSPEWQGLETLPQHGLLLLGIREIVPFLVLTLWFAMNVMVSSAASAQDEPEPEASASGSGDTTVVVTGASQQAFPRIAVQFEVRRPDGSFLLDATRDEFRVTEEGKDVKVLEFQAPRTREEIPTTIVLVVDHSGSMEQENRIGGLKRAVASFLEKLPDGSRVAVVGFSSEVERLCPFTTDRDRVRRRSTSSSQGALRGSTMRWSKHFSYWIRSPDGERFWP